MHRLLKYSNTTLKLMNYLEQPPVPFWHVSSQVHLCCYIQRELKQAYHLKFSDCSPALPSQPELPLSKEKENRVK